MKSKMLVATSLTLALLGLGLTSTAEAGPYGRHWASAYHFRYDPIGWRGGHWVHGWHGGRYGWWWPVGATWLMYSIPIYPYPDPAFEPDYVVGGDTVIVDTPAPVQQMPPPQAAPAPPLQKIWYYCNSPQGYYPYVPACPSGWQKTPAKPADLR